MSPKNIQTNITASQSRTIFHISTSTIEATQMVALNLLGAGVKKKQIRIVSDNSIRLEGWITQYKLNKTKMSLTRPLKL